MQAPFRLEEYAAVCLSLCAGIASVCLIRTQRYQKIFIPLLCLLIAGWNMQTLRHMQIPFKGNPIDWSIHYDTFQPDERADILHTNKKIPVYDDYLYADLNYQNAQDALQHLPSRQIEANAEVRLLDKQGTTLTLQSQNNAPCTVKLPLFYYPGYTAVNEKDQQLPLSETTGHRLQLDLPAGQQTVTIHYSGLTIFRIADAISCISLLFLLGLTWREIRRSVCAGMTVPDKDRT